MKSKKKYICDYWDKIFVSSRFYKRSHKPTLSHQTKLAQYHVKPDLSKYTKKLTCPHNEAYGRCKFGSRCKEKYQIYMITNERPDGKTISSQYQWRTPTADIKESQVGKWEVIGIRAKQQELLKQLAHKQLLVSRSKIGDAIKKTLNRKKNLVALPPSLLPTGYIYSTPKLHDEYFGQASMSSLLKTQPSWNSGSDDA